MKIQSLPPESIAHVFAHLIPDDLIKSTLVCQHWYHLIQDDTCWQAAFKTFFDIQTQLYDPLSNSWQRSSHNSIASSFPHPRLDPTSWRNEYRIRIKLLAKWTNARLVTLTHNPGIGLIHAACFNSDQSDPHVLSVSLTTSSGVSTDPWTGKPSSHKLEPYPSHLIGLDQDLHQHFGDPDLRPVVVTLRQDGEAIAWGMANGEIRWTERNGSSAPATVRQLGSLDERHSAPITSLCCITVPSAVHISHPPTSKLDAGLRVENLLATLVVSCCAGGEVKIWSTSLVPSLEGGSVCLWTFRMKDRHQLNDAGSAIGFARTQDPHVKNVLAVGTQSGEVHFWMGLALTRLPNSKLTISFSEPHQLVSSLISTTQHPGLVSKLGVDCSGPRMPSILVLRHLSNHFERHWLPVSHRSSDTPLTTGAPPFRYGPSVESLHPLTCLEHDFQDVLPSIHKPVASSAFSRKGTSRARPQISCSHNTSHPSSLSHPISHSGSSRVIGGDAQGRTYLWSWTAEDFGVPSTLLKPPLMCLADHGSSITSLCLTPMLVAVGGEDGTTKVYDALTGEVVRVFRDRQCARERSRLLATPHPDLAQISESYRVRQIEMTTHSIVISFGECLMAWQVDRPSRKKPKKAPRKVSGRILTRRPTLGDYRELREELENSRQVVASEHADRDRQQQLMDRFQGEFGKVMSEDEAFQYALMLSSEANMEYDPSMAEDHYSDISFTRTQLDGFSPTLMPVMDWHDAQTGSPSGSGRVPTRSQDGVEENLADWPAISTSPASVVTQSRSPLTLGAWNKIGIRGASARTNEDEELQFAIELSLAEEQERTRETTEV